MCLLFKDRHSADTSVLCLTGVEKVEIEIGAEDRFRFICLGLLAFSSLFFLPLAYSAVDASAVSISSSELLADSELQAVDARDQRAAANRKLQQYQERLDQLQEVVGAYDSAMAEAWLGIGEAQHKLKLYKAATQSFKQAIHVQRVNEGLYSQAVAPVVGKLIDSYAAMSDWKAVGEQHDFLLGLTKGAFKWPDPNIMPGILRLAKWHLYAYFQRLDEMPFAHLKAARVLYSQAAELEIENAGIHSLKLAEFYRGRAVAEYYLNEFEREQATKQQQFDNSNRFGVMETASARSRQTNTLRRKYSSHLTHVVKLVDLYDNSEGADDGSYEKALIELGDWLYLMGRRSSAFENYRKALESSKEADPNSDMLATVFSKPKPLPHFLNDYSDYFETDRAKMKKGYVSLALDIDAKGRVNRVKVLKAVPENAAMERKAVRAFRIKQFRPAIQDGSPKASAGAKFRYVYYYSPEKDEES